MNNAQRTILLIGAVVLLAMSAYPPWQRIEPGKSAEPMGYGFIWSPPSEMRPTHTTLFGIEIHLGEGLVTANSLDWSRLLTQWSTVVVLTGSGMSLAANRKRLAPVVPRITRREVTRV